MNPAISWKNSWLDYCKSRLSSTFHSKRKAIWESAIEQQFLGNKRRWHHINGAAVIVSTHEH
jgi:hypothetical protein